MDSDRERSAIIADISSMSIPSAPIIPSTRPLLVKHTGPVDEENYPVYSDNQCCQSEQKQLNMVERKVRNQTDFGSDKVLDFLDNHDVLIANPAHHPLRGRKHRGRWRRPEIRMETLNQTPNDCAENNHCTNRLQVTRLLKPGTRSCTEDEPLRFYDIHDSVRPYHLQGTEQNMIWLSGTTISSVEAEQERIGTSEDQNYVPSFPQSLSLIQARNLNVGDNIDFRDDNGRYVVAIVTKQEGSHLALHSMNDDGHFQCDIEDENQLKRIFTLGSIANRQAHRLQHLQIGDLVDFIPKLEHRRKYSDYSRQGRYSYCMRGICGEIMKRELGQIQVRYRHSERNRSYNWIRSLCWTHLDNVNEVGPWPSIPTDPLIRAHGNGHYQCGDIVEYWINKEKLALKNTEGFDREFTERSRGFVSCVVQQNPLQLKVWNTNVKGSWNKKLNYRDGIDTVNSRHFHIQRYPELTPSPLRALFHIKKTPESALMAWTLKNILGDKYDWLTVNIIAEYLPLSHQRDVYFDTARFEQVIKIQDNPRLRNDESVSECATALKVDNRMDNFHVSKVKQHPAFDQEFAESMEKWQNVHGIKDGWTGFYQRMIFDVAWKGHPTFPQDPDVNDKKSTPRHQMYAEKPYLPLLTEEGRSSLAVVARRVDIVLKPTTKLYGYQLHTVLWCHELERSILAEQSLCVGSNDLRFCFDDNAKCAVYCIKNENNKKRLNSNLRARKERKRRKRRCVPEVETSQDNEEYHEYKYVSAHTPRVIPPRIITYKGGIIADDVGLGKTLTMLSLMAAHPFKDDITRNSFHPQTGRLEFGPDGETILCAATLVVAPSHLITQWNDAIEEHFKDKLLNVVMITTGEDHQHLSYQDIFEAQVVLVSKAFLSGLYYNSLNRNHLGDHWNFINPVLPPKPDAVISIQPRRRSSRNKPQNKKRQLYQDLFTKSPFLDLFHWRRVVVDEGHELLSDHKVRNNLLGINSDFRWYLSATPFPTDLSIEYAAEYLDIRLNDEIIKWSKELNKPLGSVLHNVLYHHLYSKHTKESILSDNHLPDIEEICKMIDLHPVERLLYDITKMEVKRDIQLERQICSGVLHHFERGLYMSQSTKTVFQRRKNWRLATEKYRWNENKTPVFNDDYLTKLLQINQHYFSERCKMFSNHITNLQNELKELHRKKSEGTMIILNGPHSWSDRIPIDKAITGKVQLLQKRQRQLKFDQPLHDMVHREGVEIEIQQYETEILQAPNGQELLKIMRKFGSKQALLLRFVLETLEDPNNRIIIFSLFGKLLKILKDRLKMVGIDAGICRGNVRTRMKAMGAFQGGCDGAGGNRVILLSTKNAASGADLKLATHVVLVDPVPGSASESFAMERQAVGRAVRQGMDERGSATKVVRLVIRDTIEQEIHDRNGKVRDQTSNGTEKAKMERENMRWKLSHSLKMEDRTQDEIDFYLNIRKLRVVNRGDSKRTIRMKRKRNDKEEVDSSGDEFEESDLKEPLKKKAKL